MAQQLLYKQFAPIVKAICLRYANNASVANDLLQESFIKISLNLGQYNASGSFEGWLKKVAISVVINHNKKEKRKNSFLGFWSRSNNDIDEIADEKEELNNHNFNNLDGNSGYNLAQMSEISETELLKMVQQLPEHFRTIFNLFCIEGFTHDEIAQLLKIDSATSRTRVSRARVLLKTLLANYCREYSTNEQ